MSELRFKFGRSGDSKYFSHLDMMRMFQRAYRRAEIPVAYSQGFNPHPEFVIGMPLSVGVESSCEFVDIKLEETVEPDDFVERMNKALPPDIRVLEAKEKTGKKNIMAEIRAMICSIEYETLMPKLTAENVEQMKELFSGESFTIVKAVKPKKKRGKGGRGAKSGEKEMKEVNIKDLLYFVSFNGETIYKTEVCDEVISQKLNECISNAADDYAGRFVVFAAAGSQGNVNARIVCDAVLDKMGMTSDGSCNMSRLETFVSDGDRLVSPMSMIALG